MCFPALVQALSVSAVQQTFTSSEGNFLSFSVIERREDKSFMEETERSGDCTDTILRKESLLCSSARLIFRTGALFFRYYFTTQFVHASFDVLN